MKTKKYSYHILAWFAVLLITCVVSFATGAEENKIVWKFDAAKKMISISGTGIIEEPDENFKAFDASYRPYQVTIGEGITAINRNVFRDCEGVSSITLPDTITDIDNAFIGCTNLTSVNIPDSLTSLDHAFVECKSLRSVQIPDSVEDMGSAFRGCTGLKEINIPDNVTDLSATFSGCTGLTNVVIPSSVTCLSYTFNRCTGLTNVVIPESVFMLSNTFTGCTGLTSVDLPSSVRRILFGSFDGCENLTEVTIRNPEVSLKNTEWIGNEEVEVDVFKDCKKLKVIKGYKNSTAEQHAKEYGYTFVALDKEKIPKVEISLTNGIMKVTLEKKGMQCGILLADSYYVVDHIAQAISLNTPGVVRIIFDDIASQTYTLDISDAFDDSRDTWYDARAYVIDEGKVYYSNEIKIYNGQLTTD